jgi:leader peptidase (prepilin peptidase)/N-methyltransferase
LRHLIVELGTASLYAVLWLCDGPSLSLVYHSIYSAILILIIIIDLEHMMIPNQVIYPAWVLGILASLFRPIPGSFVSSITGALAGAAVCGLIYWGGRLFVRLAGRLRSQSIGSSAFGLGDVRLGVFVGLVVGYPGIYLAIFLAILLGGLTAFFSIVVRYVVHRRYTPYAAIPYGPFLATSALLIMMLQPQIAGNSLC